MRKLTGKENIEENLVTVDETTEEQKQKMAEHREKYWKALKEKKAKKGTK